MLKASVALASPRVPASPREASPQVHKVGLIPALFKGQQYINDRNMKVLFAISDI